MTQRKLAEVLENKLDISFCVGGCGPYAKCEVCAEHYCDCNGGSDNDYQKGWCVEGIREWLISQNNRGASS